MTGAIAALLLAGTIGTSAQADEASGPQRPWREVSAGADVASNVWLLYSSITVAPISDLASDGLRLRVTGGYGQYSYATGHNGSVEHRAEVTFTELQAGYQVQLGALTAKAFAGIHAINHEIRPRDPQNGLSGFESGPRASLELWLNFGEAAWASLDAGYTTVHDAATGRLRLGYRVSPGLSLGPEAVLNQTAADIVHKTSEYRAGAFLRYTWPGGEISASGGARSDGLSDFDDADAYATANWLMRY